MVSSCTFQLTVSGVGTDPGVDTFQFKADFLPPDDIAGKHCHMRLVGVASSIVPAGTTPPAVKDVPPMHAILFVNSLTQPRGTISQSTSTEISNQNPSRVLGFFTLNSETTNANSCRVLTYVPEGQVQMEFTIKIVNGTKLADNTVFYVLIEFD